MYKKAARKMLVKFSRGRQTALFKKSQRYFKTFRISLTQKFEVKLLEKCLEVCKGCTQKLIVFWQEKSFFFNIKNLLLRLTESKFIWNIFKLTMSDLKFAFSLKYLCNAFVTWEILTLDTYYDNKILREYFGHIYIIHIVSSWCKAHFYHEPTLVDDWKLIAKIFKLSLCFYYNILILTFKINSDEGLT